jgi:hypothetical protein
MSYMMTILLVLKFIFVVEIIKQNYLKVSKILLDKSRIV